MWILYVIRSVLITLLVVAIGEELGWRGWLHPALQEKFSPLMSSAVIGVIWGLWHLPLFFIGAYDEPPHMVFAKIGVCILLSILFTWLYNRSYGSIIPAILRHTALNNTQRFIPATEEAGLIMFPFNISLIFFDKMWRKRPAI